MADNDATANPPRSPDVGVRRAEKYNRPCSGSSRQMTHTAVIAEVGGASVKKVRIGGEWKVVQMNIAFGNGKSGFSRTTYPDDGIAVRFHCFGNKEKSFKRPVLFRRAATGMDDDERALRS